MRDITLCHPRLQALAAELIRKCADQGLQIKIGETLRTTAEQDALYAQGRTKPGKIVTNAKAAAIAAIISGEWRLIFTEPMAAVPIMIKMDSFPRSARSEYLSAWNGVETGRVLRIDLTSSSPTGDHQRVESRRFTRPRSSS